MAHANLTKYILYERIRKMGVDHHSRPILLLAIRPIHCRSRRVALSAHSVAKTRMAQRYVSLNAAQRTLHH